MGRLSREPERSHSRCARLGSTSIARKAPSRRDGSGCTIKGIPVDADAAARNGSSWETGQHAGRARYLRKVRLRPRATWGARMLHMGTRASARLAMPT